MPQAENGVEKRVRNMELHCAGQTQKLKQTGEQLGDHIGGAKQNQVETFKRLNDLESEQGKHGERINGVENDMTELKDTVKNGFSSLTRIMVGTGIFIAAISLATMIIGKFI